MPTETGRSFRQRRKSQASAGANYIDVNAGTFVGEEAAKLKWIVEAVQEATELPLSIDSPDPEVIRAVMPLVKRTPMINSITLEPSRIEGVLPLVVEYRTKVIALCQAEEAMAETADQKVELAGQLVERLAGAGVPRDDIYIDPLVYPLSTNPKSAAATLEAIARNHENSFPASTPSAGSRTSRTVFPRENWSTGRFWRLRSPMGSTRRSSTPRINFSSRC